MYVKLKHVHRVLKGGRAFYYHRITRERLDTRDRPYGSEAFKSYVIVINAGLEAGPGSVSRKARRGTMGDLVALYRANPAFTGRKPKTRKEYSRYLDYFETNYGDLAVRELDPDWVQELQDEYAETPRKADFMVSVLSILCSFAVRRRRRFGLAVNPCAEIERINRPESFKAWPPHVFEAFHDAAYQALSDVVAGALNTGQRKTDVAAMDWTKREAVFDDDLEVWVQGIWVRQEKTGELVWIPETAEFTAVLERRHADRQAAVIFTTKTGRPWSAHHLSKEVRVLLAKIGHPGYSLHGLRYNAAEILLEIGCTNAEARSITGHAGDEMLNRYGRKARQKILALNVYRKRLAAAERQEKAERKRDKTVNPA